MTPTGDRTSGTTLLLTFVLFAGFAVRVALLPVDVTSRVDVWKIWSFNTLTEGVAALYGTDDRTGGRRMLEYEGRQAPISSPPGVVYGLALAGRLYQEYDPVFTDGPILTAAVKLPLLLAELLIAGLVYVAVRRIVDPRMARWSMLAYWLNPAVILSGAALGFQAPLFVLPAVGALVFASWAYPMLAGVLFVASLLTNLQALMLLPVLALALGRRAPLRTEAYTWATGAAVLTGIAILTPLATAGTLPSASRMVQSALPLDAAKDRGLAVWNALPAGLRGVETAANAASPSATGEGAGFSFLSTAIQSIESDPEPFALAGLALVALWTLWRGRAIRFLPGWALPLDAAKDRGLAVWNALPAGLRGVETAANAASPSATGEGAGFSFLSTAIQSIESDPEPFALAGLALVALWTLWRGRAIRFLPDGRA